MAPEPQGTGCAPLHWFPGPDPLRAVRSRMKILEEEPEVPNSDGSDDGFSSDFSASGENDRVPITASRDHVSVYRHRAVENWPEVVCWWVHDLNRTSVRCSRPTDSLGELSSLFCDQKRVWGRKVRFNVAYTLDSCGAFSSSNDVVGLPPHRWVGRLPSVHQPLGVVPPPRSPLNAVPPLRSLRV